MPKTAEEVLQGLLSTSLKLDAETVTALKEADGSWKDEAPDTFIKADADRVAALNKAADDRISAKASTVKRETMEEVEKFVREEFGIKEVNVRGLDLIRHAKAAVIQTNGTLTEDKVKAHPYVLDLENKVRAIPETTKKALEEHETKLKSEFKREANYGIATKRAQVLLDGMKPNLPKNAEVAANQRALLDGFVQQHTLDFVENSNGGIDIIPMAKDGSGPLKDSHGHAVSYEQLVKIGAAKYFEFQASDDKDAAPDPTKAGAGSNAGGQGGSYDPKTTQEYAKLWATIDDNTSLKLEQKQEQWALLKAAGVKNGVAS